MNSKTVIGLSIVVLLLIIFAGSNLRGDVSGTNEQASVSEAFQNMQTTNSGLAWKDITVGTGAEVVNGSAVSVHYEGTLTDGTKFDSSYDRGTPFTVTVGAGQVISGWEEGLLGMRAGGKRELVIPPSLAYGDRDLGVIPPNSTLRFVVEVVEVN